MIAEHLLEQRRAESLARLRKLEAELLEPLKPTSDQAGEHLGFEFLKDERFAIRYAEARAMRAASSQQARR